MGRLKAIGRDIAVAALSMCVSVSTAFAQSSRIGAELGLAGQQDNRVHDGVGLSPVGLLAGLRWMSGGSERRFGLSDQVSLFPVIAGDKLVAISGGGVRNGDDPRRPLFVNLTMLRGEVGARDGDRGWTAFGGVGSAAVLLTPRESNRFVPVFEAGGRYAIARGLSFGASVQCGTQQIGETRCIAPFTFGWALRH